MPRKGNLAVFETNFICETKEATPTKICVHAFDINPSPFLKSLTKICLHRYSSCDRILNSLFTLDKLIKVFKSKSVIINIWNENRKGKTKKKRR